MPDEEHRVPYMCHAGRVSFQRYETADGTRWRVRWRENGRMRSRSFLSRNDARGFDADVKARQYRGDSLPKSGKQTLAGAFDEWWATDAELLAPETRNSYERAWKTHVSPRLGHERLAVLAGSPSLIKKFLAEMRGAKVGNAAQRKALTVLSAVLSSCVEDDKITSNPVRQISKKPPGSPIGEAKPLNPVVVERIRRELRDRQTRDAASIRGVGDACFVSLLAYGGLRPGEALALTFADIDAKRKVISVNKAVQLDDGGVARKGPTKTKKDRTPPLVAPLADDVAEWQRARGNPPDSDLLFPNPSGDYWSRDEYNNWRGRVWKKAVRRVAAATTSAAPGSKQVIDEHIASARPYDLRGSFVSLHIWAGESPVLVAEWTGHSTRVMFDHYTGVIDGLSNVERIPAGEHIEAVRRFLEEKPKEEVAEAVAKTLESPHEPIVNRAHSIFYGAPGDFKRWRADKQG